MKPVIAVVLAAALAAGCKKSSTPAPQTPAEPTPAPAAEPAPTDGAAAPQPTEAELEVLGQRALTLFRDLTRAAQAAGADCAKMAADMRALFDQNKDLVTTLNGLEGEAEAKFEAKFEAEGEKVAEEMFGAIGACKDDPAVQKVFADQDED